MKELLKNIEIKRDRNFIPSFLSYFNNVKKTYFIRKDTKMPFY